MESDQPSFAANTYHDILPVTMPRLPAFSSAAPLEDRQAQHTPIDWRSVIQQAVIFWVVTRLAYALFTFFYITVLKHDPLNSPAFWNSWFIWDGPWYLQAAQGYTTTTSTAFFPLYPLCIAAVNVLLGGSQAIAAALIASNLIALGTCIGIAVFAAQEEQETAGGLRLLRIMFAYPWAFFMTAPYSEGLLIALLAFSLFFMRRGAWRAAALMAFLAGLTRITAVILILPLAWEYGRQHGWWEGATWRTGAWRQRFRIADISGALMVVSAVPLAIGLYMLFLWRRFNNPVIFLQVEHTYWHHASWTPWYTGFELIRRLFPGTPLLSSDRALQVITLTVLVIFGGVTLAHLRRIPVAFTLYMLGLLYLVISANDPGLPYVLPSAARYLLEALPIFWIAARWAKTRSWLDSLIVNGGWLLQGLLIIAYMSGLWIE